MAILMAHSLYSSFRTQFSENQETKVLNIAEETTDCISGLLLK